FVAAPTAPTNDTTPTFTFASSAPGSSFTCRFDTDAFAACASPFTPATPLSEGTHTLDVQAKDAAGNVGGAGRLVVIDLTPPSAPPATPSPTPWANQTVVVQPAGGTVLVRIKGTNRFVPLNATQGIPLGSEVDTRHGKVELSAVPKPGAQPQSSLFYGGIF